MNSPLAGAQILVYQQLRIDIVLIRMHNSEVPADQNNVDELRVVDS